MIYIIITTCVYNDCNIRKSQYIDCISNIKFLFNDFSKYKIIIVENNGLRSTYLDDLGCDVYYTNNNFIDTINKGYKELKDVFDTITEYSIQDDDFIVKITGRYFLKNNSEFINCVKKLDTTDFDCIIKYGSYMKPVNYKTMDCITGLIGMRTRFVKKIVFPKVNDCVEWKWAEATYSINDEKIHKVDKLDLYICPASNTYFLV